MNLTALGIGSCRQLNVAAPRPFRTPWVPLLPIAGAVICLAQMICLPIVTWERLFVWLVAGLAIHGVYGARRVTVTTRARDDGPAAVAS